MSRLWYLCCFSILFANQVDQTIQHPMEPIEPFSQPFMQKSTNDSLEMVGNEWVYHDDGITLQDSGNVSYGDAHSSTRMGNVQIFESQNMDIFTETNSTTVGNRVIHESSEIPYFLPNLN